MTRSTVLTCLCVACGAATGPPRAVPAEDSSPSLATGLPTAEGRPENVLIVVVDDLGIDKVRSYHPELDDLPVQPTLDALASQGVRFETAYAAPLCSPARATLLTGRYPHQHGLGMNVGDESLWELPPREVLLSEVLARDPLWDWSTGYAGKWHLGSLVGPSGVDHPTSQGFEQFQGTMSNLNLQGYWNYYEVFNGEADWVEGYATTRTVNAAVAFVDQAAEPWFLVASFHAPHGPVHLPPENLLSTSVPPKPSVVEQHHAMIEALDTELGRLLAHLDPEVRERTHIVLVGDNGSSDYAITEPFDPERGKGSPYEGGVRVPFIVAGPAVQTPGVSEAFAHIVDVFPTVLELVGVPDDPAGGTRGGLSLGPHLADPNAPGTRDVLYTGVFQGQDPATPESSIWTIRNRTHKLVVFEDASKAQSIESLFVFEDGQSYTEGAPIAEPWDAAEQAIADELRSERDALLESTPAELP